MVKIKAKFRATVRQKNKNNKEIAHYIKVRLLCRRFNRRPLELSYGQISRKLKKSYKQVRNCIDWLEKEKLIKKYRSFSRIDRRRNYYVWVKKNKELVVI